MKYARGFCPSRVGRLSKGGLAITASLLSAAPAARAAVIFYDNEAAWEAAVADGGKSPTTFTFTATPGSSTSYSNAAGYTADSVNFVGRDDQGFYLDLTGVGYFGSDYLVAALQGPPTSSAYYGTSNGVTDLTFLGGTTAFGLRAYTVHTGDTTGSYTDTLNLTVDGLTGTATSASGSNYLTLPGSGFIGFISTTPVTSGVLTGTGAEDFVSIAQLSNVPGIPGTPEPSTWAMMLLGFAGLGWAEWRRGRVAARTTAYRLGA
jgi:hypothetical protein